MDNTTTTKSIRPLPEALTRNDNTDTGEWQVGDCAIVRGEPLTVLPSRMMVAPHHDHPTARVVRAHEMIHAKVSPQNLKPWLDRGIATEASLRACEEYRVNHLVKLAGFDTNALLDGSERLSAERMVAVDDWAGMVHLAMGVANTGGYKEVLKALRKHKPVWAKVIDDIVKRANREARKSRMTIASTDTTDYGSVVGFEFTERIAEWCDRLGDVKPPEPPPAGESGKGGDADKDGESGEDGDIAEPSDTTEPPKRKRGRPRKDSSATDTPPSPHSRIVPSSTAPPAWFTLKVEKLPTPIPVVGAMGKKRVASNSGRHPRRLHRLMTDPHKRVFDRVIRGKGGVVVIDCSGSMHLESQEVRDLTEASHGATVLAYTVNSWSADEGGMPMNPNAWILSERGRMADLSNGLPFSGMANGVDLPALQWAVANRRHASAPIVWVCDGYVTGMHDNGHPLLTKVCYEFVKRNRILLVPDVESAVRVLRKLGQGGTVIPNYKRLTEHAPDLCM